MRILLMCLDGRSQGIVRKDKWPQPPGDIVHGFSNNGANCLFIFFKAVIKFTIFFDWGGLSREIRRLSAFSRRGGAVFVWGGWKVHISNASLLIEWAGGRRDY
ncbi:hypothetical protein Q644_24405 [Brucella intermedia 229E]|uniref:Uncharacterized protein n=1 Tax=Brucella intermedia 229E TaxID=1337887 RepID=U4V4J8_9HYPH|nr:hypothetical protein Q644_24405 [Brucella intermedia 229E]